VASVGRSVAGLATPQGPGVSGSVSHVAPGACTPGSVSGDRHYSAVVTTGIYCRPGCGARPRDDHVHGYGFAAAAEAAGFRACLRCRPYRSSDPPAWLAGPELVCRAVQLVLDGALDRGTEPELGARLGVSERHLRRLFREHVGATPDQLARSRRVHFARRLLDDTDLSVADVAFAAGFGSVRQLNRSCREVFRAPPRELRARRRRSDRLVADGGLLLRLPVRTPFDWEALVGFLARRAIPGVEHVSDGTYRRTIVVDGDPGVVEVRPDDHDHLLLRVHLPHWEPLIHLVARTRRLFDLDADPEAVAAHLGVDPALDARSVRGRGLRVAGAWDPFETGVRVVVGQQVTVAGANALAGRLVERYGTPVAGLGALGLTHTFPPATTLADADLADVGLPARRAEAVRAFAAAVADGTLRLDGSVGLDELVASLVALPGLGPWTAHALAMRLGERDAFPASDLALRRALGDGRPIDEAACAARAERWRPWRAYAAMRLWADTSIDPVTTGADRR